MAGATAESGRRSQALMRAYLATYLPKVWQDKTHPVSKLLYPLSLIYGLVIALRQLCYRLHILPRSSVGVPVIVVGNVTVGGTGKTPLVIWLAGFLQQRNLKVGIIARGYGGSSPTWPVDTLATDKPEIVGDEAVLMKRKLNIPVVVSPSRVDSARMLIDKHGVDIIISDDGLQHLALQRDLEIIVIDAKRLFGNGRLLPSGPLRQRTASLSAQALKIFSAGDAGKATFTLEFLPVSFRDVGTGEQILKVDFFKHKHVNAVAGIGFPEKFFHTLRSLGMEVHARSFPDHHHYQPTDFEFDDDRPILMTEKDAVKCQDFDLHNAWYLDIVAKPNQPFVTKLEQFIDKLKI